MMPLNGKVALVTGGSRGIGQAVARELADHGARVVIADLVAPGPGAVGDHMEADVSDAPGVQRLFEGLLTIHGQLDILVNNAGIRRNGPTESMAVEDWAAVLGVNLTAAYLCSAALARHVFGRGSKAAIVNIASAAAEVGLPGRAAYCASKAGLVGLTRALAVEWADRGIRVNAVGPGFTRTHMYEWAIKQGVVDEVSMLRRVPMDRVAEPHEIARAVRFLASDDASYITGQALYVDGGWLAMGIERTPGDRQARRSDL